MDFPSTRKERAFVDAHVHIRYPEGIASFVAAGIAAVRDAGMRDCPWNEPGEIVQRSGLPVIISAAWAIYKKGGYGSRLGAPVETQAEIKTEIFKLKNAGAAIIKVIASGLVSLTRTNSITPGGFSREELAFIVQEAAGQDLAVMAHANGEDAIVAAAEAGVRSVEHGFFMTAHALEAMAKKGTYWIPTVGALSRAAHADAVSKEMQTYSAALITKHMEMIGRAHAMKVPLALGTDCVLPDQEYKTCYDAEISSFAQSGISRNDVIAIACEGGARLLGI